MSQTQTKSTVFPNYSRLQKGLEQVNDATSITEGTALPEPTPPDESAPSEREE